MWPIYILINIEFNMKIRPKKKNLFLFHFAHSILVNDACSLSSSSLKKVTIDRVVCVCVYGTPVHFSFFDLIHFSNDDANHESFFFLFLLKHSTIITPKNTYIEKRFSLFLNFCFVFVFHKYDHHHCCCCYPMDVP